VTLKISFVLVCEGSFDRGLLSHLETLCVRAGADEAAGTAPDLSVLPTKVEQTVASKVRAALALEPAANLVFVHRDSDSRDPEPRYQEISSAMSEFDREHVAVVPVQETEAWLILDEDEIRHVASNPNGKTNLNLPKLAQVEDLADPKATLRYALVSASGLQGRRLARFKRRLPTLMAQLLRRLDLDGPIVRVPAWQRLQRDLEIALGQLAASATARAE